MCEGIVPVKEFWSKLSHCKPDKDLSSAGIVPLNRLSVKSTSIRAVKRPNTVGSVLEMAFADRYSDPNEDCRSSSSSGIVPVRSFILKSSHCTDTPFHQHPNHSHSLRSESSQSERFVQRSTLWPPAAKKNVASAKRCVMQFKCTSEESRSWVHSPDASSMAH